MFILLLGILMAILSSIIDYIIDQLGLGSTMLGYPASRVSVAHQILSLELISDSQWYFQLILWVLFPLLLVLFSVGFVQLVSIHAIGWLPSYGLLYCHFFRLWYPGNEDNFERSKLAQLSIVEDVYLQDRGLDHCCG